MYGVVVWNNKSVGRRLLLHFGGGEEGPDTHSSHQLNQQLAVTVEATALPLRVVVGCWFNWWEV